MIQGYVTPSSVSAGETITIHVGAVNDTDRRTKGDKDTKFRTYFFRRGADWELKGKSDVWTATALDPPKTPDSAAGTAPEKAYEPGDAASDWNWPGFDFTVPASWRSGVYVALFAEEGRRSTPPASPKEANKYSRALFVINVADEDPGTGSTILYKVPLFTYCAYNHEGNCSLYEVADKDTARNFKATLNRPGCGIGGDPWDGGEDFYVDKAVSLRNSFLHWDAPFIAWLEAKNYNVDYCTDLDVHENRANFLKNYNLLLSVGHDEYWSDNMRSNLDDFVAGGKNIAFFSANTCWWRVSLVDSNTGLTCNKVGEDKWCKSGKPEAKLTGVSYRNAGGWWSGERTPPLGFTVQDRDHWVYSGTGLGVGDKFGEDEAIVGYECDGAGPDSPSTFVILGVAQLDDTWEHKLGKEERGRERLGSAATMGVWTDPGKGTVFTAATTDWARVLTAGSIKTRRVVERITQNVLDKLK